MKTTTQSFGQILLTMFLAASFVGCGTWLGSPSKPETPDTTTQPPQVADDADTPASNSLVLQPGEVSVQSVELQTREKFVTKAEFQGLNLLRTDATEIEISVLDAHGNERLFDRPNRSGFGLELEPSETAQHYLVIRNRTDVPLTLSSLSQQGASKVSEIKSAAEHADSATRDIFLKSVVAVSRECKETSSDGQSTLTIKADTGKVFLQVFAFMGVVKSGGIVDEISDAKIYVSSGDVKQTLQRLDEMPSRAYREISGMTDEEHRAYTKAFYRAYFGAAGEMYTIDAFRKYGSCSDLKQFPISSDIGQTQVSLTVQVERLGLNVSESLRFTASAPFSTYLQDVKVADWTQCTFNKVTGLPEVYNGTADRCKEFSLASPPVIRLDYKLPSSQYPDVYSRDSDPTRALFYGHAKSKEWVKTIIDHSSEYRSGARKNIDLVGCAFVGGMSSTALKLDTSAEFPLKDFHVKSGDIINLARKTGSYTSLLQLFQGTAKRTDDFQLAQCIPDGSSSCADYKVLQVRSGECSVQADSGVFVTSIGDAMIYPDYFEISGVVQD